MEYIVGIGEYVISADNDDVVKTFSLSTCVAIIVYDINKKILCMAHTFLPQDINKNDRAAYTSAKYADRAVYNIFEEMTMKYKCNKQDLKVTLIGGIDSKRGNYFRVGEQNLAVIKKILDKMNVRYNSINTGGRVSRSIIAYTANGEIQINELPITIN